LRKKGEASKWLVPEDQVEYFRDKIEEYSLFFERNSSDYLTRSDYPRWQTN